MSDDMKADLNHLYAQIEDLLNVIDADIEKGENATGYYVEEMERLTIEARRIDERYGE